jgi:hypothetical protein
MSVPTIKTIKEVPDPAGKDFPLHLVSGYHLHNRTVTPTRKMSLAQCMANPLGFSAGYANNRYILSGFAFGEIFGFIKAWNKAFIKNVFIVRRKVGLEISKINVWGEPSLKESSTPSVFFVSIEIKNALESRFVAKLLAVFLRAFFYGEAAGSTPRVRGENYLEYFLRITNLNIERSHYFDIPVTMEHLIKIDQLEKVPEVPERAHASQTYILRHLTEEKC